MTLQIREATPADAMLLNTLGYRIYCAHFEQKATIFEHPAFERFFCFSVFSFILFFMLPSDEGDNRFHFPSVAVIS
ncbi:MULTISPECIES: hypothetical protein [Citrobacter]|uniref:hypothetical protein n=1 Tax=Citrobacter TaxID=544 RepID=UPI001F16877F|nr:MULTISPECIES: hypothetical protein [Citrobacter]MDM2848567.1 hypothetical protein [Citrobacter sp. Cpo074]